MVQPQELHKPAMRSALEAHITVTAASYTAKAGDCVIGVNRAGTVTITLPTAEVRNGRVYAVKDESGAAATNNITVATEGSENIDGAATDVIDVNYESKSYYSDGTNWFILPVSPNTQLTLATTVSTQAHGDAAAGGSATTASKGDHKHAMPASGAISQATQAALEAETNEDTYGPPDLLKYLPWSTKVFAYITGAGALNSPSYGVSSVTDTGTGDRTINFTTSFSSAVFTPVSGSPDAVSTAHKITYSSFAVGSVRLRVYDGVPALVDVETATAIYGDL